MPLKKPRVVCRYCEHEYPLEEAMLESVEHAEGQGLRCRVCASAWPLDRLEEKEQLRVQQGERREELKGEQIAKQRKALEERLAQMDVKVVTKGDIPEKNDV